MIQFQNCLNGEAKYVVARMVTIPKNIDLVINIFQMHFGRSEFIIDILLSRVGNLTLIRDQSLNSLTYLSNNVRSLVLTILSLSQDCHLKNSQVLRQLIGKLSE